MSSMPNKLESKILYLYHQGKKNRAIARELDIHHNTVSYWLKKHNLRSNYAGEPIDMVDDSHARCRKCLDIFHIDEFQFGRKGQKYEYKFAYCNKCRKAQAYLNLNSDINKFLADRFRRLKLRSKKENIPFDLTKDQFIKQYNDQNGLCFYTDTKLICEVGSYLHRDSLSIDKIIPEKGYVLGNTVFTTHRINTCKNDLSLDDLRKWMTPFFFRIKLDFLKKEIMSKNIYIRYDTKEAREHNGGAYSYKHKTIHITISQDIFNTICGLAHEYGHAISHINGNVTDVLIASRLKDEKDLSDYEKDFIIKDEELAWSNARYWLLHNGMYYNEYAVVFEYYVKKHLDSYKKKYGIV